MVFFLAFLVIPEMALLSGIAISNPKDSKPKQSRSRSSTVNSGRSFFQPIENSSISELGRKSRSQTKSSLFEIALYPSARCCSNSFKTS